MNDDTAFDAKYKTKKDEIENIYSEAGKLYNGVYN
jgi:hypothetical protein